jgi:hypothetical protein
MSFIASIVLLPIDGIPSNERREQIATFCTLLRTVIHHALPTPLAVRAISVSMIEPPLLAALMSKTAFAQTLPPRLRATRQRAIAVASVTAPAKKENLATAHPPTDHMPKCLHVPNRGTGENLVDLRGSCDSTNTTHVPVVGGSVLLAPGLQTFVVPRIAISANPTQTYQFHDLRGCAAASPATRFPRIGRLDLSSEKSMCTSARGHCLSLTFASACGYLRSRLFASNTTRTECVVVTFAGAGLRHPSPTPLQRGGARDGGLSLGSGSGQQIGRTLESLTCNRIPKPRSAALSALSTALARYSHS